MLNCLYDPEGLTNGYERLIFPAPPIGRPYIAINYAMTLDGKTSLSDKGSRGLGSETDLKLLLAIRRAMGAVITGAAALRVDRSRYSPEIVRIVVTASGDVPNEFLTAPGEAIVLKPEPGRSAVDLATAIPALRSKIDRMVCEGGGYLNDQMLRFGLVDEIFVTLAPKIKGGRGPTGIDGIGLEGYAQAALVSAYEESGELYLRYRLAASARGIIGDP